MNARLLRGAGLGCVLALAGCITTADRSGDRAGENGFWRREGLALKRIVTSPVTIASAAAAPYRVEGFSRTRATFLAPWMAVWGCGETVEELAVGLAELLSGRQFESCAYPMERFRFDVEDWRGAPPVAGRAPAAGPEKAATEEADAAAAAPTPAIGKLERQIADAAAKPDWKEVARLCRLRMAASVGERDRTLSGVRLAAANWNAGDRIGAIITADLVVSICARKDAAVRREAEAFRARLRKGDVPAVFPAGDLLPGSPLAERIAGAR